MGKKAGNKFFLTADNVVVQHLKELSEWTTSQNYEDKAVRKFLESADYYLIAHAKAHGMTVVTHEVEAETKKRVKIPNACIGMGVDCVNTYEMLRREKACFILGDMSSETE